MTDLARRHAAAADNGNLSIAQMQQEGITGYLVRHVGQPLVLHPQLQYGCRIRSWRDWTSGRRVLSPVGAAALVQVQQPMLG